MTHVVGRHNRSEFILDPVQALRRGRALDAMLGIRGRPEAPRGRARDAPGA